MNGGFALLLVDAYEARMVKYGVSLRRRTTPSCRACRAFPSEEIRNNRDEYPL